MAGQTVVVSVLADTRSFARDMQNLGRNSGLNRLGSDFTKLGKTIAAGFAVALGAMVVFGKDSLEEASKLQQSIGGVDAVFKDSSKQIHSWAKGAAADLGLSQNAYNEAATSIGTTLKNAGIPLDQIGEKTNDLVTLSADLAATFGGSVPEATAAMGSALRGEFEPLRRFGISLNQADINTKALTMSGKENASELTKQEKALATQVLMYEQSADAQGAFARESNTLAGQTERLRAKFVNFRAELGTYLLPIATKVTAYFSDNMDPALRKIKETIDYKVIPAFQRLEIGLEAFEAAQDGVDVKADGFIGTMATLGENLDKVTQFFKDNKTEIDKVKDALTPASGLVAGLSVAFAGLVTVWKVIKLVTPVGLILTLITTLIYAWQNSETFRDKVKAAFKAVQDFVAPIVTKVKELIEEFGDENTETGGQIAEIWDEIKETFETAYEAIKTALEKTIEFIEWVWEEHGEEIVEFLSGVWDALVRIVKGALNIIEGVLLIFIGFMEGDWTKVWEGVQTLFSGVWDVIKGVALLAFESLRFQWEGFKLWFTTTWDNTWENAKGVFEAIWDEITGFFERKWEDIKGFVSTGVTEVKTSLSNAWEEISSVWTTAWSGISTFFGNIWGTISGLPGRILGNIKASIDNATRDIGSLWNGAWGGMWSTLTGWWNTMIDTIRDRIGTAVGTVRSLPGKVINAIGDLSSLLWRAGREVIQGFIDGINSKVNAVKQSLNNLTDKLTSWKGPESLDKVILKNAGQLVIGGFITGLESEYGRAKKSLTNFTKDLSNTDMGVKLTSQVALDGSYLGTVSASSVRAPSLAPTYNITVQTLVPTADTGREIVKAIRDYERAGGIR